MHGVEEVGGTGKNAGSNSSEHEMPADKKYGKLEVQGVIDIVIINYDAGAKDDPDGNDNCGRRLDFCTTNTERAHSICIEPRAAGASGRAKF